MSQDCLDPDEVNELPWRVEVIAAVDRAGRQRDYLSLPGPIPMTSTEGNPTGLPILTQLEPVRRNSPRAVGQRPARRRLPAPLDVPTRPPDPIERDEDPRAMEAFKIVAPEGDSAFTRLALEPRRQQESALGVDKFSTNQVDGGLPAASRNRFSHPAQCAGSEADGRVGSPRCRKPRLITSSRSPT